MSERMDGWRECADPVVVTEDDLRRIVERSARLGDWDEWTKTALGGYNALTVTARAVLGHLHGQHDDSALPCSHCLLCELFRDARRGSTPAPPPVPPWPGAVLSGLCDEDGEPTWLAQAGQVRGEQVRACTSVTWLPSTSHGEDEWVEVRAPRAVPAPETERVQAWEAVRDGRQVVGASSPFEAHYIWRSGPGRAFIGERTMDKAVLVAPDGTVEVLVEAGQ